MVINEFVLRCLSCCYLYFSCFNQKILIILVCYIRSKLLCVIILKSTLPKINIYEGCFVFSRRSGNGEEGAKSIHKKSKRFRTSHNEVLHSSSIQYIFWKDWKAVHWDPFPFWRLNSKFIIHNEVLRILS